MKRKLLLLAVLPLLLAGCDSGEEGDSSSSQGSITSAPTSQVVGTSESGTTGATSSVVGTSEGTTQSTSGQEDPETPLVTFKKARKATVESIQYEYDFNLTAKIKFAGSTSFSPANYSGTTWVNTGASSTKFLQKRSLTGALVFDSTNYIYNVGTDLIKISADEDKDFSVINHETVSSVYDFDKNNFSQILKELNDNNMVNAELNNGKYELSFHTNFSQDSLLGMLNKIDSKKIINTLNKYTKEQWGVNLSVNVWATLTSDNAHISKFHFDAGVAMQNVFDIQFEFEQTFKKYSGVTLQLPEFQNTIVEENAVKAELASVLTSFNNAKQAETSYYKFDVKTAVDHGVSKTNFLGLAVNSHIQGIARRQLIDNKVYFNNKIEVDSDYKNDDQYGDLVKDYNSYRAKLNDGNDTVYDVLDKTVGFNQYVELTDYNESAIDEYYMLPSSNTFSFENLKVVKKTQDNDGNNIYKFGLSNDAVRSLLSQYDSSIRIDFDRVTLFDIYRINSDFEAKKAYFVLTTNSEGKLVSLDIDLKGFYIEEESGDQVKYRLQVEVDYNWSKSYSAATRKQDIDN